jgi:hypothetical protein
MQTQITIHTIEAEYIALSQAMRDLIPICEFLKEIMSVVCQIPKTILYHTHSKSVYEDGETEKYNNPQSVVFEDNDVCLKFSRLPQFTPQTKHIGIPYQWFCKQVNVMKSQLESD